MDLMLDGKANLNKVSLTGMRAITLLGLLVAAPRSLQEIREFFLSHKIMEPSHSNDIIRIDINTLKSLGCEISRSSAKTDFKYVLSKHPFGIPLTEDDVKLLKKFFDKIKNTTEISKLLECHELLNKIVKLIGDEDIKEKFSGISPLKHYNTALIRELLFCCNQRYTIKLAYQKAYTTEPEEKDVVAQRLIFQNDKLYLYCYDLEKKDSCTLLFKRIKSVISKRLTENGFSQNPVKVTFILKDSDSGVLLENEKVQSEAENGFLVTGDYFNEFLAIQRILSLGSNCVVKEPTEFKEKIISKLKNMRKLYE